MEKGVKMLCADGVLSAHLSGEIDHHFAKDLREEIDSRLFLEKPPRLILDFSGVRFMDSSGVGLIIGRSELCSKIGCELFVGGLSPSLRKLMKLSGIEKINNIKIIEK